MNSTMNDLALLAIGAGVGLALALVAVMVYALWHSASSISRQSVAALKKSEEQLATNRLALQQLQHQLSTSLQKLDAERLYHASLTLQRLVKSFSVQVEAMQKAVFAQPASPAIDFGATGMNLDEEAEDDARMLVERNRWAAVGGAGFQSARPNPPVDSLDGLSEEEKAKRVLEYFERQRAARAGFPYATVGPVNPSAPPTAGSGIYASLLEEASQRPPAPVIAPDFSGLESEEGVDLVGKGELE